jgi:hypothetical protein
MNIIQKQLTFSEKCIFFQFRKNKFREHFIRSQFHKAVGQYDRPESSFSIGDVYFM